jgi:membrane protein implicated in regulation of membrane protease activity
VSQSRRGSAIEAVANVVIGYWIAVGAQAAIFPLFGVHLPLLDNMLIGALFTVVSLVRSYLLRRLFNRLRSL